jgi:GTP-binding protein
MVIGENSKQGELPVNPTKTKKLTNVRSTGAEEQVRLAPPRRMTIEEVISYMDADEVLEVTPSNVRLRKRILNSGERQRARKANRG